MLKTLNQYIIGKDMLISLLKYTMRINTYWISAVMFLCVFKFPFKRCLNTRKWISYEFLREEKIDFCVENKTVPNFFNNCFYELSIGKYFLIFLEMFFLMFHEHVITSNHSLYLTWGLKCLKLDHIAS